MANIVIYDETTKQVKDYKKSVHTPDFSSRSDVVINPDVSGFENVPIKYWREDGGLIREMTQVEKDAVDLYEQAANDNAEAMRLSALDDKISNIDMSVALTKADNAINNIGSLADAKVFLKRLVRFIVSSK